MRIRHLGTGGAQTPSARSTPAREAPFIEIDEALSEFCSGSFLRSLPLPGAFNGPVIVAVAAMWMVKMTVDEVVHMITVRHALVPAPGTVHVSAVMTFARMIGRALRPIPAVAFQDVLVNMITVHMMQVTVMQIVGVPVVFNRCVTAARRVRVRML